MRKDVFNKIKAEQLALPVKDRVPHYFDSNKLPMPYSKDQLKNMNEDEVINVLNYEEHQVPECTVDELV